jgi:hypothetical protein
MDRESKATHDAASLYIPYLLQTPAERAAAAALEHKKDSMAAAKYTSALILRTSESVLDAAGKSAGRDARTYIAKLLQSAALDRETVAASVSAIIYAENLLWKLALEASPARQAWLRRVEGGRAAGANELAGQDMLVQQAAARLSAKGRDVVAGALDLAYREYMLAISKPNDVVAGEWASLVIQSELVAIANGRPVSPVQDGPMEAGLVRIAQELVGTAEIESASTVFQRVWDARTVDAELTRLLHFLLGDQAKVLDLAARLREAQVSADEPSEEPRALANILVIRSFSDAVAGDTSSQV